MKLWFKKNWKNLLLVALVIAVFLMWFLGKYKIVSTHDVATAPTTQTQVAAPAANNNTADALKTSGPSFYKDTSVNKTETFTFTVKENEIGIVGGYQVDSTSGGVYKALTPGNYTFKVTDGFVLTIDKSLAQGEWDFRLNQAKTFHWAMAHIEKGPLN